jgi:hypothetical protein
LSALILNKLKVNNDTKNEVKGYLDMVPDQKVEEWNMFRTIFSVENSNNANYLCLMTYLNANNKLNVYMVQMSQNFELAQDVLVIRNSYTTEDGKFSFEQESIEHVPHEVTETDLQQILDFFDIITFKRFMKQLGADEPTKAFSVKRALPHHK